MGDLCFDENFDFIIGIFNLSLLNGENFVNISYIFFDVGIGINFCWQVL